ncbi:LSm family protein [Sutcliffiella horikoshii]|uniref:hypothetical protein n=1 Tax=Sutcliffiella horikoshii TaxID=79883 RepID=UPI001CFF18AE|nr:hypothetical protein [Sutcliffiella horikoshii]
MATIKRAKPQKCWHHSDWKRKESSRFTCPDCVPADHDDSLFCTPYKCPDRIPQPKFPSPNSSLQPEELEELQECIQEANQLLLALGLERDEENLRAFQAYLRGLRMSYVSVTVSCEEEETTPLKGAIVDAGVNFLILQTNVGNLLLIPFERIVWINQLENDENFMKDQELLDISLCLRRCITLHFSEVVSKSPFLLNLFYGIELWLFLESYVGCLVYVKQMDEQKEVEGILISTDKRKIEISMDGKKQGINFDKIQTIEIEQEALTNKLFECHFIRPH